MRRLPGGSVTVAAAMLGVLLLAAAFPDSFLFRRLFTVRRWLLPFERHILVVHVLMVATVFGWSAFTAWFVRLRRSVARTAEDCAAAWGRVSPLVRDRAVLLSRAQPHLRQFVPGVPDLHDALELALKADRSAVTPRQMIGAANLMTGVSGRLCELLDRQGGTPGSAPQLRELAAQLRSLDARIESRRVAHNLVADRYNRLLRQPTFSWMAGLTTGAETWPHLAALPATEFPPRA